MFLRDLPLMGAWMGSGWITSPGGPCYGEKGGVSQTKGWICVNVHKTKWTLIIYKIMIQFKRLVLWLTGGPGGPGVPASPFGPVWPWPGQIKKKLNYNKWSCEHYDKHLLLFLNTYRWAFSSFGTRGTLKVQRWPVNECWLRHYILLNFTYSIIQHIWWAQSYR